MRPAENIEKLVKKLRFKTSAEARDRVLGNILRALDKSERRKPAVHEPNIWRIIAKSRITQVAAVLIVLSAICLLTLSDKGELEQHESTGSEIAVISETPAEMVSAFTLNMAFRNGGMQAMEKQFDKAEKKVKPGLKMHLTVEQLICELDGC